MGTSSTQFRAWRKRFGLTQAAAGQAIGRSLPQIQRYEDGTTDIDRTVELAMAAVETERHAPLMMREVWARVRGEE